MQYYQGFMNLKFKIPVVKSVLSFLILVLFFNPAAGQQTPLYPISYRILSPFIFNPAIAGSKDYSSVDFISGWQGKSNSQIISVNSRLIKQEPGYFMSPVIKKFSNIGIGGYLFNEKNSPFQNIGFSAGCSYQIPLDRQSLSFISFGAAVKGVYNIMDSIFSSDPLMSIPGKKIFYPNVDLGIYYYGPKLFAGISATNLLGNPEDPDSLGISRIQVSRRYLFVAGYKIILNKSFDLVLEPSLILNSDGSRNQKITDILKPMLKVYVQSFCLGTYFNNYDNISFFIQYKYPKFYVGTFFEIPRNTAFYKKDINVEIAFGINFSQIKTSNLKYYHW
jgi:type IX secretion system PorP/SprF family membrane protein